MSGEELRRILRRRPFKPVRVHISSGETVDLRHPEEALVSQSTFAFATGPLHNDVGWYNLIHVVKVVPLTRSRKRHRRQSGS
jgi:hypothetical protein